MGVFSPGGGAGGRMTLGLAGRGGGGTSVPSGCGRASWLGATASTVSEEEGGAAEACVGGRREARSGGR
eukprot:3243037-Pleurochrysis_carterae.AAC.1